MKTIQIVLHINPRYFKLIQRCAKLREKSVEEWIIGCTEGELQYDMDEFRHAGIKVGFDGAEIDKAMEEVAV